MTVVKGEDDFHCRVYHCPDAPPLFRYLGMTVFGPNGLGCHHYGANPEEVVEKARAFWKIVIAKHRGPVKKILQRGHQFEGMFWVKNEQTQDSVRIKPDQWPEYEKNGYVRGRIMKKGEVNEEGDTE